MLLLGRPSTGKAEKRERVPIKGTGVPEVTAWLGGQKVDERFGKETEAGNGPG